MVWKPGQFPEEPRNFNPDDRYADPVALIEKRESVTRRKAIDVEKAKLLREQVRKCYLREGVNHFQKCKEWTDMYLKSIQGVGFNKVNSGQYDKSDDWLRD
mmetsp:Transcript_9825/g.29568  ORF Transcript_9825/g.29568 Transcript_9825/m.29568 type:complete len:101 (-) Transcript_9825:557-859(-)